MENKAIEAICSRRSVRKYKPQQISKVELETVLRAGVCAPSGRGRQSAIIVVVQDKDTIDLMSKLNARVWCSETDPFFAAPTVLVVLAEASSPFAVQDGSLVMGNLMNAASAIGLGSCWVNRAKEVFEMPEGKALLERWGIKGEYIGIANCVLGYPDEAPQMRPRKPDYVHFI